MVAVLFSAASVLTLLLGVGSYVLTVKRGSAPSVPVAVGLSLLVSTGLALAGLSFAQASGGPFWLVVPLALVSLATTPLLLLLHSRRHVPTDTLRVKVGDRLVPFAAVTPDAQPFHTDELHGERVLLKFFRGEWCPFCQVELKRFNELEPSLGRYGVRVVALSKDTPEAARRHRERDSLRFQLLCDPELHVIRQYGLEHRKALEISDGPRVSLLGMAVGTRPSFRHMAAPTTLLVDETGVIRWIDQTDDYKVRSGAERVLGAVHAAFGDAGRPPEHTLHAARLGFEDEPLCAEC